MILKNVELEKYSSMISDTTIRKLVDYISLNACSVNSSGLYNGTSGISLALFETAKCLQDTEIEDKAFSLFQESLIRKQMIMALKWYVRNRICPYLSNNK